MTCYCFDPNNTAEGISYSCAYHKCANCPHAAKSSPTATRNTGPRPQRAAPPKHKPSKPSKKSVTVRRPKRRAGSRLSGILTFGALAGLAFVVLNNTAPDPDTSASVTRSATSDSPARPAAPTVTTGRTEGNSFVYEGEYRDGVIYGRGKMTYSNGDMFEGDFVRGQRQGTGTYTYSSGIVFTGAYYAGKQFGPGVMTYPADHPFVELVGEWDNNTVVSGKLTYRNGDVCEGEFTNDQVHGTGVMTYANGDRYSGTFGYGKPRGRGVYTFSDGSHIEATFTNGVVNNFQPFAYRTVYALVEGETAEAAQCIYLDTNGNRTATASLVVSIKIGTMARFKESIDIACPE